jgi:hypothetical protein
MSFAINLRVEMGRKEASLPFADSYQSIGDTIGQLSCSSLSAVMGHPTSRKKYSTEQRRRIMKILMVLTSHDVLGNTGRKTGFWLEEFAAPTSFSKMLALT